MLPTISVVMAPRAAGGVSAASGAWGTGPGSGPGGGPGGRRGACAGPGRHREGGGVGGGGGEEGPGRASGAGEGNGPPENRREPPPPPLDSGACGDYAYLSLFASTAVTISAARLAGIGVIYLSMYLVC